MEKLISFKQAKMLDKISQENYAIPELILMEHAGIECSNILIPYLNSNSRILIVCGSGNNGGDGLVMARLLFEKGYNVCVYMSSIPKSELAKIQYQIIKKLSIPCLDEKAFFDLLITLTSEDWIVDAITGIGLEREFNNHDLLNTINASEAKILSVDVPTGLLEVEALTLVGNHVLIQSDITVSIGLAKTAMYIAEQRAYCGLIIVAENVFPQQAILDIEAESFLMEATDIGALCSPASTNSYKYSKGSVVLDVGSKKSPGAAVLAIQAASKGPAGIVHAIIDDVIAPGLMSAVPSVVTGKAINEIKKIDSIVVGSGWEENIEEDSSEYNTLMQYCNYEFPMIIDASALHIIAKNNQMQEQIRNCKKTIIITPHLGELKVLFNNISIQQSELCDTSNDTVHWWEMAKSVASYYDCIVCAKHSVSMLITPKGQYVLIDGSNPFLAKAGSGDVLAGIMGSVMAYFYAGNCHPYFSASINKNMNQDFLKDNFFSLQNSKAILKKLFTSIDSEYILALTIAIVASLIHQKAGDNLAKLSFHGDASDIISQIPFCYT